MMRIIGIILMLVGTLGLVYGGFSFTQTQHEQGLGPLDTHSVEHDSLRIPPLAGIIVAVGGLLLFASSFIKSRPKSVDEPPANTAEFHRTTEWRKTS